MATIIKRPRKGGSFSYLARIRIARRGQPDFTESRTFPKKAMAEEWAKRRELELMQPGGILTAKWRGVTMNDATRRPRGCLRRGMRLWKCSSLRCMRAGKC